MRSDRFHLAALALAMVGYWAPWLSHQAAALRMNAYELSEWITLLPGVRDGSIPLSRLLLLLPLGSLGLLLSMASARRSPAPFARRRSGLVPDVQPLFGWILLGLGLLCALLVLPPWPYVVTAYADPEYQGQLFIALAAVLAVLAVAYLPAGLRHALQVLLAASAGAVCLWSLPAVRPAASELLGGHWAVGPGWLLALAGFAALALGSLARLFGPRD
jgi:hypothetical protein